MAMHPNAGKEFTMPRPKGILLTASGNRLLKPLKMLAITKMLLSEF